MRQDIVTVAAMKMRLEQTLKANTAQYEEFLKKVEESTPPKEDLFACTVAEQARKAFWSSRLRTLNEVISWVDDTLLDLKNGNHVSEKQP